VAALKILIMTPGASGISIQGLGFAGLPPDLSQGKSSLFCECLVRGKGRKGRLAHLRGSGEVS